MYITLKYPIIILYRIVSKIKLNFNKNYLQISFLIEIFKF